MSLTVNQFYPNGTKQSKQGNVFLLLYLRSTPEISRMSATCRVWLTELDKGREHYKDFNDKNKYTGWRSGLVKTAEIQDLSQLTFQVTVTIFEIYDQDGNNVTNKYIGLGIDSKQTITYLRKELQQEKQKVQQLTIEVDEYKHFTRNLLRHGSPADDEEEEDDHHHDDDDGEEVEVEETRIDCVVRGGHHNNYNTSHSAPSSSSMDSMMSSLFGSPSMDSLPPNAVLMNHEQHERDGRELMMSSISSMNQLNHEHDLKTMDRDDNHNCCTVHDPKHQTHRSVSIAAISYPNYGVHGDFDEEKSLTVEHRNSLSNGNHPAVSVRSHSRSSVHAHSGGSGKVEVLSTGSGPIYSHSGSAGAESLGCDAVRGDVFKIKFKRWLCDTVKLGQYLELFEKNECDDVRMIEFFEEKVLEKELGIKRTFHRKLIMKKAKEHTAAMREFEALLEQDHHTKPFRESLEMHGIMNTKDLRESVSSKEELMAILSASSSPKASKLRRERQQKSMEKVWDFVQSHLV